MSALRGLRQEACHTFKASLSYTVRPYLKIKENHFSPDSPNHSATPQQLTYYCVEMEALFQDNRCQTSTTHSVSSKGLWSDWSTGHRPRIQREMYKWSVCSCIVNLRVQGLEARGLDHLPLLLSTRRALLLWEAWCLFQDPLEQAEQSYWSAELLANHSPPTDISYSQIKIKVRISFSHLSLIIYIKQLLRDLQFAFIDLSFRAIK